LAPFSGHGVHVYSVINDDLTFSRCLYAFPCYLIMVALWNRSDHYIFSLFLSSFFFFFISSPNLSGRRMDVYHTSTHACGLSANLECRSEMCCTRLAENTGRKKVDKK